MNYHDLSIKELAALMAKLQGILDKKTEAAHTFRGVSFEYRPKIDGPLFPLCDVCGGPACYREYQDGPLDCFRPECVAARKARVDGATAQR